MQLLTTGLLQRALAARGIPEPLWKLRAVLDKHFRESLIRVGQYRAVPDTLLDDIADKLRVRNVRASA